MSFNYSKLKGRITEVYGSQHNFAAALGKYDAYVTRILKGAAFLSSVEIETWAEALNIDASEILSYFFAR